MTADSASATAVNSAIMAAADQILAGLKGGNLFPSSADGQESALPISHVAASISQARASEVCPKKNEPSRCSPTGVHQQAMKEEVISDSSAYAYPNDANCVTQSSQVTFEEPNSDILNKIASASSLTSSEHSHGESRLVEVVIPSMHQQVAFASPVHQGEAGTDDKAGGKRGFSQEAAALAMEPPPQKPRLDHDQPNMQELGGCQPTPVRGAQEGGQERTPPTASAEWVEQQFQVKNPQEGAQVPGQTTFQPILPAALPPLHTSASHERPKTGDSIVPRPPSQEVQHHVLLYSPNSSSPQTAPPKEQRSTTQAGPYPSQGLPPAPPSDVPHPSLRATSNPPAPQPHMTAPQMQAPAGAIAPRQEQQRQGSYCSLQGAAAFPHQAPVAQTHAQATSVSNVPGQTHGSPKSYYSQPTATVQGSHPYAAGLRGEPVPIAPAPPPEAKQHQHQHPSPAKTLDVKQPNYQGGHSALGQPAVTTQGQTYVIIAPAPAHQHCQQGSPVHSSPTHGQPSTSAGQVYVAAHQPAADARGKPEIQHQHPPYLHAQPKDSLVQKPSPAPIAPARPSTTTVAHYHHQQTGYSQIPPAPPAKVPPTSHQKALPPIYPKPCPTLQYHDHQPKAAVPPPPPPPQKLAPQPQQQPTVTFSCGVPTIPRTSQIETSSIQLDHMDHQLRTHHSTTTATIQDASHATATLAVAPCPSTTHTHHHLPQHNTLYNSNENNTLHQNAAAANALRRPSFPPPPAAKSFAVTTTYNDAPPTPRANPAAPEVASNLRNQRMQPTDCLLFAASLLQESPAAVAPPRSESHVIQANNGVAGGLHANGQHHPSPQAVAQPHYAIQENNTISQAPVPLAAAKLPLPVYPASPSSTQPHQDQPQDLDVLCGRGGLINKHIGNIIYRRVVEHNKPFYQSVQKRHRILVSQSIVHTILNRGGRFLSEDTQTITNENGTRSSVTLWKPVATSRAIQKTSQALRERVANDSASKPKTEGATVGEREQVTVLAASNAI